MLRHRCRRVLALVALTVLEASSTGVSIESRQTSLAAPSYAPYQNIAHDFWPAWSPDDRQIIYTRFVPPDHGALNVIPSTGGQPKAFLGAGESTDGQPAWSPDGQRIAFTSNRSGLQQIWTANSSGGDLRQLTTAPDSYNVEPCWSPDGKKIVYSTYPSNQIMIVPSIGGQATPFAYGYSPAWSPDGKRIAYLSTVLDQGHPATSIFVKALEGGGPKRLSRGTFRGASPSRPTVDWSPDGQRLLTTRVVDGTWEMTVINVAEDRLERTIPVGGSALFPRWSHDGKQIVFSFADTGNSATLRTVTPDGGTAILTKAPAYTTARMIRYKSADGLDVPAYLYMSGDAGQGKHPALIWLHGGAPGEGSILNEFDPGVQYFVDQGFVVLAPVYRGSAGFGEDLARLRSGDDIVPSIAAGASYLKSIKTVDAEHLGVVGFSFGGYLTLLSIAREPEIFAAAVDYYGFTDLITAYQDSPQFRPLVDAVFGGSPKQQPDAYRAASPALMADRIKTPVLMVHGTADEAVPYSQTVELAEALMKSHKELRGGYFQRRRSRPDGKRRGGGERTILTVLTCAPRQRSALKGSLLRAFFPRDGYVLQGELAANLGRFGTTNALFGM